MNSKKLFGITAFILSTLFFYLPLFNLLINLLGLRVFDSLYLNDKYSKKYDLLLMVGNYPYLDIILISIAITLLIVSKSSISKFLFYPTLIIQLFILIINLFLYSFFGAN
jgi:hypothetical protein